MKISACQSNRRQTNWATTNWAIGVGQLGMSTGQSPQYFFRRFVHVFILVNLYWGLMFCCVVIDVNECANNNGNCHSQANCTNTPGTFTCTCLDGYSGDGITCSGKEWTIVLYFTLLRKFCRRIRTLAATYCRLLLVLRNTMCIIQLIMIISRYCGDNHVWNLVNFLTLFTFV